MADEGDDGEDISFFETLVDELNNPWGCSVVLAAMVLIGGGFMLFMAFVSRA